MTATEPGDPSALGSFREPKGRAGSDPNRPERIIEAALRVIEIKGVGGLTHRAVAAEAGVPVGSTTYYFRTLDDILVAAIAAARARSGKALTAWIQEIADKSDLAAEFTDRIVQEATKTRNTTLVAYELYFAALRRPALRRFALDWVADMARAFEQLVDPDTADAVGSVYDGVLLRALISPTDLRRVDVERAFRQVID